MGQCVSRKAIGVYAASSTVNYDSRPMAKPREKQSPDDNSKEPAVKQSRGVSTSFGFKRRQISAIPVSMDNATSTRRQISLQTSTELIDNNGNDNDPGSKTVGNFITEPVGTDKATEGNLVATESLANKMSDTPETMNFYQTSRTTTQRLQPPKKELTASRLNRFGFRQSNLKSKYDISVNTNECKHAEYKNNNFEKPRSKGGGGKSVRISTNTATPAIATNALRNRTSRNPTELNKNKNKTNIPQPTKFTFHTSQLPRPQLPIRVIETKNAKTVANLNRKVSATSHHSDEFSSKEGSVTEDSGIGSTNVNYETDTLHGIELLECSPTFGARKNRNRNRNLDNDITGQVFDIRNLEDTLEDEVVTEVAVIPLPRIPSVFSSQPTYIGNHVTECDNNIERSRRKISITSSEGFSEENGEEEKSFRDRSNTEKSCQGTTRFFSFVTNTNCKKANSSEQNMSPLSSEEQDWAQGGEGMIEEYNLNLSSSDESKDKKISPFQLHTFSNKTKVYDFSLKSNSKINDVPLTTDLDHLFVNKTTASDRISSGNTEEFSSKFNLSEFSDDELSPQTITMIPDTTNETDDDVKSINNSGIDANTISKDKGMSSLSTFMIGSKSNMLNLNSIYLNKTNENDSECKPSNSSAFVNKIKSNTNESGSFARNLNSDDDQKAVLLTNKSDSYVCISDEAKSSIFTNKSNISDSNVIGSFCGTIPKDRTNDMKNKIVLRDHFTTVLQTTDNTISDSSNALQNEYLKSLLQVPEHIKFLTDSSMLTSSNHPTQLATKDQLRSVMLTIEDPKFAAVAAASAGNLLDDETSPIDSLISSYTESDEFVCKNKLKIDKNNSNSSNSKDLNEKLSSSPTSPGTPTNTSLSFSEGRDFLIDDEIADQPALIFNETIENIDQYAQIDKSIDKNGKIYRNININRHTNVDEQTNQTSLIFKGTNANVDSNINKYLNIGKNGSIDRNVDKSQPKFMFIETTENLSSISNSDKSTNIDGNTSNTDEHASIIDRKTSETQISDSLTILVNSTPKNSRKFSNSCSGSPALRAKNSILSRADSVDTLSPCESIASDDLMLDFDQSMSSGIDDSTDRLHRNETTNALHSLDQDMIRFELENQDANVAKQWSALLGTKSTKDKAYSIGRSNLVRSQTTTPTSIPDSPRSLDRVRNVANTTRPVLRAARTTHGSPAAYDSDDSLRLDRFTHGSMVNDIVGIKTMLIKLKRVLQETDEDSMTRTEPPLNPLRNGYCNGLLTDQSDHDSLECDSDITSNASIEMAELRRQIEFLQSQLEDKERTVQMLQNQVTKYSLDALNTEYDKDMETCNAATQTERVRPLSAGPSLLQNMPAEGAMGPLVSVNDPNRRPRPSSMVETHSPYSTVRPPPLKLWRKPGEPPPPSRYLVQTSSLPRRARSRSRPTHLSAT